MSILRKNPSAYAEKEGIKGVIVYLVSPRPADVADLCHSLRLLHANFFQVFARCYDVIVFHDGLSDTQISRIKVFVCVCMYIRMYACVYVCIYVCVYVCADVC